MQSQTHTKNSNALRVRKFFAWVRRHKVLSAFLLLLLVAALFTCHVRSNMGRAPDAADLARFQASPNYFDGHFRNKYPATPTVAAPDAPPESLKGFGFKRFIKFLCGKDGIPATTPPVARLTRNDFPEKPSPSDFRVIWLGHATLLIELGGTRILCDPIFGDASPVPGLVRRFSPPPLPRAKLPAIDIVLITHDHYDHLEAATARYFKKRATHFIAPLGVGARLRGWGIPAKNITELDWFETTSANGLTITAVPTQHHAGRTFKDRRTTLWCAFVVTGAGRNLFLGGDSGYDAGYVKLGEQFGPFDMAALGIGSYNARWAANHFTPEEAVRVAQELRAATLLPIHWAAYSLAPHPWDEPIHRAVDAAQKEGVPLLTPMMGQPILPGVTETPRWW